jgi:MerR family transcriptional regulator, light-induced transcriptional regulator
MLSKSPAFNLKAVLRETSLAADTLRAWERRYGLPMPQRTGGGHRLYSQYDIETIKWLTSRQAEGLSISRAVDLWNEILASGTDPLADSAPVSLIHASSPALLAKSDTTMNAIRAEWINACMNFNETLAEQTLNKAFSLFQVEDVCLEVLQKGMAEIGDLWFAQKISVQQEHFASGLAMRRIDALLSASPAPSRPQTILVGCPPGEWHTFTPLFVSLLLRRRGLNVIYLGANVPADRFAETALKIKANLVILVSQTLVSAASLQNTALALNNQQVQVAFGGRVFNTRPNIKNYITGHFLGKTLEPAIQEVEKLLKEKPAITPSKFISEKYITALSEFNAKRSLIENTFKDSLPPLSITQEEINTSIYFLGNNIIAALQLGNLENLDDEMEWVKVLLKTRQRSSEALKKFILAYSKAIGIQIHNQGEPITDWLKQYLQKL